MRPGDYVFAFRRRGVQFNPQLGRLRWTAVPRCAAEAGAARGDGALFRLK